MSWTPRTTAQTYSDTTQCSLIIHSREDLPQFADHCKLTQVLFHLECFSSWLLISLVFLFPWEMVIELLRWRECCVAPVWHCGVFIVYSRIYGSCRVLTETFLPFCHFWILHLCRCNYVDLMLAAAWPGPTPLTCSGVIHHGRGSSASCSPRAYVTKPGVHLMNTERWRD